MSDFTLTGAVTVDTGPATAQLRGLGQQAQALSQQFRSQNFDKSFVSLSRAINVAERALISFVAIAGTRKLVAFANESVEAFARLEAGIKEIQSLSPELEFERTDFSEIREGLDDLRDRFAILTEDSIPALYQAISSGIPRETALDFLAEAAELSIAGVTDLKTATDGLTTAVNAYGAAGVDAARASDVLFTTVQLARTDMEQLSKRLFQVAPIASLTGVSLEEVAAGLTAITRLGTPTRVAATQLRQVILELGKEGSKAATEFRRIEGISFLDFIQQGGTLVEAINKIGNEAEAQGDVIQNKFNSVIAGAGAAALATGETFEEAFDTISSSTGATAAAARELRNTFEFQFKEIKAIAQEQAEGLGESIVDETLEFKRVFATQLLPALADLAEAFAGALAKNADAFARILTSLTPLLEIFAAVLDKIPATALQTIATFAILSRVVKPLIGIGLGLAETFLNLRTSIGGLRAGIGAFGTNLAIMRGQLMASTAATQAARAAVLGLATTLLTTGIGVALVGISAALSFFSVRSSNAAKAQREFAEAVDGVTDALITETGVLDTSSEALQSYIANSSSFAEGTFIDDLREAGITIQEVTTGLEGFSDTSRAAQEAFAEITDALDQDELESLLDAGFTLEEIFTGEAITASPVGVELERVGAILGNELTPAAAAFLRTLQAAFDADRINIDKLDQALDKTGKELTFIEEAAKANLLAFTEFDGIAGQAFRQLIAEAEAANISFTDLLSGLQNQSIDVPLRWRGPDGQPITETFNFGEFLQNLSPEEVEFLVSVGVDVEELGIDPTLAELDELRQAALEAAQEVEGLEDAIASLTGEASSLADLRIDRIEAVAELAEASREGFSLTETVDVEGGGTRVVQDLGDIETIQSTLDAAVAEYEQLVQFDPAAAQAQIQTIQQQVVDFVGGREGILSLVEQDIITRTEGQPLIDTFLQQLGGLGDLTPSDIVGEQAALTGVDIATFLGLNPENIAAAAEDPALQTASAEAASTALALINEDFNNAVLNAEDSDLFNPFKANDPTTQLQSYFDDFTEDQILATFEATGLAGVISPAEFFELSAEDRAGIIGDITSIFTDSEIDEASTLVMELDDTEFLVDLGEVGTAVTEFTGTPATKNIALQINLLASSLERELLEDSDGVRVIRLQVESEPIPTNAAGGIFTKPTLGIYGEAGKEAIIPLTRPARALQLADKSGLTDLIESRQAQSNYREGDLIVNVDGARDPQAILAEVRAMQRRRINRRRPR